MGERYCNSTIVRYVAIISVFDALRTVVSYIEYSSRVLMPNYLKFHTKKILLVAR